MTIEPDSKDWTWVLERPCPQCEYDAAAVRPGDLPALIREQAQSWRPVLDRPDAARRPDPARWSPLEYGCHVRDVLRLYDERLGLMLAQDDPLYGNWDQDATAVEQSYGEQDPGEVAGELEAAGERLARSFTGLDSPQWARTGRRSDGASFTVESFARYFLHDVVHHRWDVADNRDG